MRCSSRSTQVRFLSPSALRLTSLVVGSTLQGVAARSCGRCVLACRHAQAPAHKFTYAMQSHLRIVIERALHRWPCEGQAASCTQKPLLYMSFNAFLYIPVSAMALDGLARQALQTIGVFDR